MIKTFEKVIEKLILFEFPCIINYGITLTVVDGLSTFIRVHYYINEISINNKLRKILIDKTMSLYKMIGNTDNFIYTGVDIRKLNQIVKCVDKNDRII